MPFKKVIKRQTTVFIMHVWKKIVTTHIIFDYRLNSEYVKNSHESIISN